MPGNECAPFSVLSDSCPRTHLSALLAETHSDLLETAHDDGYYAVEFGANTVLLPERKQVAQISP